MKNISLLSCILLLFSKNVSYGQGIAYPKTKKTEVRDTYHGTVVPDPYRWLEDENSAETAEWVKKQNDIISGYFSKIPYREGAKALRK